MKAIVANVLFGGIFVCLSWANSAYANPKIVGKPAPEISTPAIISSKLLPEKLPVMPTVTDFVEHILTVDKSGILDSKVKQYQQNILHHNLDFQIIPKKPNFSQGQRFYIYQEAQSNLILGFQNTFWPSKKNNQYWGITTVEHWGKNSQQKLNLAKLNYTESAPILPAGSSTLTVSGGGNQNLTKKSNSTKEFEEFRGGITYHRGLVEQVTMGVGFIYEDLLTGFTQLSYNSDRLPLQTTLSLLAKDSQVNFHSHIRFQPAKNFILNYYYNEQKKQQFDVSWNAASGFTIMAKGNSKNKYLTTGIKVAISNQYLSISANATLDNNNNLQWKFNSQIGPIHLIYDSNEQKNTSELNLNLINSNTLGVQGAAFIKYDHQIKPDQEDFTVWGGKLQSVKQVGKHRSQWSIELGVGSGSYGQGLIANGFVTLKPNLALQLTYQEISPISDETKFKLQLGS